MKLDISLDLVKFYFTVTEKGTGIRRDILVVWRTLTDNAYRVTVENQNRDIDLAQFDSKTPPNKTRSIEAMRLALDASQVEGNIHKHKILSAWKP